MRSLEVLHRLEPHELEIEVVGYVESVGDVDLTPCAETLTQTPSEIREIRDATQVFSLRPDLDEEATRAIDAAKEAGDTLGGVVVARVFNVPFGLGTHAQWSSKLDGRLAQAVAAIQAFKGVEIGDGFKLARVPVRRRTTKSCGTRINATRERSDSSGQPTARAGSRRG